MKEKYDLIVYIGRFQPPHNGHINTIRKALKISKRVLVLIGSSNISSTPKNPFTAEERYSMIKNTIHSDFLCVDFLDDNKYKMEEWISEVQNKVYQELLMYGDTKDKKIGIIGYVKDNSSFYLKSFPQWEFIDTGLYSDTLIHATKIREIIFQNDHTLDYISGVVPIYVYRFIRGFILSSKFPYLRDEYDFLRKYNPKDFPRNEVTTDAVIIQSGHVLTITRKNIPGKGLLALPGGFVSPNETIEDSMIRELKEETNIRVPEKVLRGSIKKVKVFDDPGRSDRGRIITHAFYIHLKDDEELPRVSGGDDASNAQWLPISQVLNNPRDLYSDHWSIIEYFI